MAWFCLMVYALQFCRANGGSPLFIWSNEKSIKFPQVIAGCRLTGNEFYNKYLKEINNQVVIFLQYKISVVDMLVSGGVYGCNKTESVYWQFKTAMLENPSAYIPQVENPIEFLLNIENGNKTQKVVSIDPQNALSSINSIDLNERSIILVNLSSIKPNTAECDAIIGKITSYLSDRCLFTAFLTGIQSGIKLHEDYVESAHSRRPLQGLYKEESQFDVEGSTMVRSDELSIDGVDVWWFWLNITHNECGTHDPQSLPYPLNCTAAISITKKDVSVNLTMVMKMKIVFTIYVQYEQKYWKMTNVTVDSTLESGEVSTDNYEVLPMDIVPVGFSFSCKFAPILKLSGSGPLITFVNFQIQIFRNASKKGFGDYHDCSTFFTIPIWMAMITCSILLSITAFAIEMLLSVNGMDKYDDPKGKSMMIKIDE